MSLYGIARAVLKVVIPIRARVSVDGLEHVPPRGPFFLVLNHRSILDPVFAQVACPRKVHSMTKSTQFRRRGWRWLLVRLGAFPTRRYRVDPQTVRTTLRLLEQGRGVGIYPEGERSWDGRLQPLRLGSIRLLLKPGVPVIPCGISGSYHLWPRWGHGVSRGSVRVRFGEPLLFGRHDTRRRREEALPGALASVRSALASLSGGEGGSPEDPGGGGRDAELRPGRAPGGLEGGAGGA